MIGAGPILYGSRAGAPAGFINVAGARNGLEVDAANYIVLGQTVGQAGNPAVLLSDRQLPFNGFKMYMVDQLPLTPFHEQLNIFNGAPLQLVSGSSDTTGGSGFFAFIQPQNYGQVYADFYAPGGTITMDGWSISHVLGDNGEGGSGMPDAVLNIGYNTSVTGGRNRNEDASWRLGFETNFLGSIGTPSPNLDFEFHLPEVTTFGGVIFRTNSYYLNKTSAYTLNERRVDITRFFSVLNGNNFCTIEGGNLANEGTILLSGTGAADVCGHIQMENNLSGNVMSFVYGDTGTGVGDIARFRLNATDAHGFDMHDNFWLCQTGAGGSAMIGQRAGNAFNTLLPSALLQLFSTTQGFLPPQMTTVQKLAIPSPANGIHVYDTTLNQGSYWNGTTWINY